MKRLLGLFGALLLLSTLGASQTSTSDDTDVDPRPGLIDADSPLYGLDVAVDTVLVSVGLKRASKVVEERAWESKIAAEDGNMAAAEQAAKDASHFAQVAHTVNDDGSDPQRQLEDAETLLREVRDRVSEEAHAGIDQAISEVMKARERLPTDLPEDIQVPDRPDTGGETPSQAMGAGGDQ